MAQLVRKLPVTVEAMQYDGTNGSEIQSWSGGIVVVADPRGLDGLVITTLEGVMAAFSDDWIIRGVNGEFYPCKPDIFEKTYELVLDGKGTS